MSILSRTAKSSLVTLLVGAALLTTGCSNMITTAGDGNAFSTPGTMTGKLHGGNQPISQATVKLYATGTTGYGSAGTLLATTSTANDGVGSFSFTQQTTGGPYPNSGSSYLCPSSNSLLYIIANGGSTDGSNTNFNTAAAFLIGIGTCSTAGSAVLDINEITSAASIFALEQYINPGAAIGSESVGSPSTVQALVGINNAFAIIPKLVNISTGVAASTFTPPSSVAGITMTGTPESAKLITIANILASCVNNPTSAAANCATLFANATPPAPALTSQPGATFNAAVDTIQAAYYMATNPIDGNVTNLANLFNLQGATPPFQTGLATAPSDWTISVSYTAAGTCTNANAAGFLASPETAAVDKNGNVWMVNGASIGNALVEFGPTGAALNCQFGTIPSGRGITIDTAGNVWTAGSNTTNSVYEYLVAGGTTLNWPTSGVAVGIASDGAGNVFYTPSVAAPIQEYVGASALTATAASVPVGGSIVAGTGYLYLAADPSGRLWAPATSGTVFYDLYPGGATPTNGYSSVDVGTASGATNLSNDYGAAIDSSGNIYGGNTCCANAVSNMLFKVTPGSTAGIATFTNSVKFPGGLVAPRSTAVDGAGNIWAGMAYPTVTAALNQPANVNIFALAEVDKNFNSISYAGPNGASGPATCSSTGTNCPTQGGFQKANLSTVRSVAIDPSGNVWAPSSNGFMVEFIGSAVPVVTPLSTAAATSTLGTKP